MIVLKVNKKSCNPLLAPAIWHIQQSDNSARSGAGYANLRTCTSKRAQFSYQLLKSKCAKHQNTNDYWRAVAPLEIPIIATASARGYDGVTFALATSKQNVDAPIAYYLITNIKTGQINKVSPNNAGPLSLSNLSPLTSYTFTIAAVSVDGTSLFSSITPVIKTSAVPVVEVIPAVAPLAAPAFTLSSSSESRTVNTAATGFTILSTGGAIASFAISATPPGMSFDTTTGALTGTPNTVASATTYTITATNASGSTTRTFSFTVTAVVYTVGQTGPGGGTIFYVASAPFSCGPTRATTCTYLEAAPSGWNAGPDPATLWAVSAYQTTDVTEITNRSSAYNNALGIGLGYQNSAAIVAQNGIYNASSNNYAAGAARAYTGGSKSDWYLPTTAELNLLCQWGRNVTQDVTTPCTGGTINTGTGASGGFVGDAYWSSTEYDAANAWLQYFNDGSQGIDGKGATFYVRPVRAF